MKNILINVHTEYHLMVAVNLYLENFSDKTLYRTCLLIPKVDAKKRFKNVSNLTTIGFDEIIELDFSMGKKYNPSFSDCIKSLLKDTWRKFIFFHEQTAINVFLAYKLKKKGTVICLAPDGAKPYIKFDKLALPSRIKETINVYKFLNSNKLYFFRPYFLNWNYARLADIDEVWVQNTDVYKNATNKIPKKITLFAKSSYVDIISKIFNFNISSEIKSTTGIFFYVNNILYKKELYFKEIDIIKELLTLHPGVPFYMKIHPLTPKDQVERFNSIPGIILIQTSIPAELYIASLKQSSVLSMWSAALMNQNENCLFHWIYPILEVSGDMLEYLKIDTPFPYIKLVRDIKEVELSKK